LARSLRFVVTIARHNSLCASHAHRESSAQRISGLPSLRGLESFDNAVCAVHELTQSLRIGLRQPQKSFSSFDTPNPGEADRYGPSNPSPEICEQRSASRLPSQGVRRIAALLEREIDTSAGTKPARFPCHDPPDLGLRWRKLPQRMDDSRSNAIPDAFRRKMRNMTCPTTSPPTRCGGPRAFGPSS